MDTTANTPSSAQYNVLKNQLSAWLMRRTAISGARRVAPISAGVATEIGNVRTDNQDRVAIARIRDRAGRAFVVAALADGIGGMQDGAEGAATAIGCLIGELVVAAQSNDEPQKWLARSAMSANRAVHTRLRGNGGSTLAATLTDGTSQAHWLSVGDSRVYSVQGQKLTQLSVDDTIAGQLGKPIAAGLDQSKLLQFIGIGEPLEPHVGQFELTAGGSILLTSDGVHFLAPTPDWLGLIVAHAADPGASVNRLVQLSKWCGGPDNASAAIITWSMAAKEESPLPYSCLQVWDSFGELQVIFEEVRCVVTTPSQGVGVLPPRTDDKGSEGDHARGRKADRANAKSVKTRRTRGPRKGNRGGPKLPANAKDSPETEVPQLLIEFPDKTD